MISLKQKKILAFPYSKFDALICDGAIRSGKTSLMTVAFVDWAMREFNNTSFAICGKTVGSAIKNIILPYVSLRYAKDRYNLSFTRSDNKLVVSCGRKENTFYIYGGKDESSFALIQGITLGGVLLDEVALITRSFTEQALARCSIEGSKFWFNCNPESPNHWFYLEWIKGEQPKKHNALHLHFLLDDNPSLSEGIKQRYQSMFSGVFYDRYIKGEWVIAEGAIYKIFTENKNKFYTDNPDYDFIQIGLDFGGNKSAHAICATGLKNDMSKITALMAERYNATGTSPEDLYLFVELFVNKVIDKYGTVFAIYADSAEQTLINGLKGRVDGVRNSLKKPIIDRIRCTTALMSSGRFFITKDCKPLVEAFEMAVYDTKSFDDKRLDDGSTPIDDLDGFEYSFEKYIRQLSY